MIITNKYNLPHAFVDAVSKKYVNKEKRYSVTTLLQPVRVTMLQRRHGEEATADCSEFIWALFGTAVHSIFENAESGEYDFSEEKLAIELENGYTLSGIFDCYEAKEERVVDYKTTSVVKVLRGDYKDYWYQLGTYAWMLEKIGFKCRKGRVVAIMRDHIASKARYDKSYPQCPVKTIDFEYADADFKKIEQWILDKFKVIAECEQMADDDLPECTMDEKFQQPDKFAVMKKGRKTALRVLNSYEEAEKYMAENGGTHIDVRKSTPVRCLSYCNHSEFCCYCPKQEAEGNDL